MSSFPNQDNVIIEVGKAYDHIKKLQALSLFKPRTLRNDVLDAHELAQPLFEDALQALNHSLHMMKSAMPKIEIKQEIKTPESRSPRCSSRDGIVLNDFYQSISNRRGKRKWTEENSWTYTTTMPCDDGYQWRKYGDKKISGTNYSRSYFRCTFKEEQGCLAKKLVQETTNKDSPNLFHVTYINKHTCNSHKPIPPAAPVKELAEVCGQIVERNNYTSYIANSSMPPHGLADDNGEDLSSSRRTVKISGEWDIENLIMELVGFDPADASFVLT